jgi:hypothetical protein
MAANIETPAVALDGSADAADYFIGFEHANFFTPPAKFVSRG